MNDYLNADCVFSTLISNGVLTLKVWKNTLGEKTSYNVIFDLAESARRVGFCVYIKNGQHCIGRTSLQNISRQFQINLGDIEERCAA